MKCFWEMFLRLSYSLKLLSSYKVANYKYITNSYCMFTVFYQKRLYKILGNHMTSPFLKYRASDSLHKIKPPCFDKMKSYDAVKIFFICSTVRKCSFVERSESHVDSRWLLYVYSILKYNV